MSCFIWPGYSTETAFATRTADPTVASDLPVHPPLTLPAADCQTLASAGPTHMPRKRALRRAIGRAARHPAQTTHYKGRLCTLAALREAPALRSRRGDTDSKQGPRLTALSWNVGGLSQEAWLEVQIWMHEQTEHDVILLQETHWRFTSSWSLPRYHIFHSGATDHRFQGCMIAIRKSIASFESVRWSTPLVGHLMHVRFPVQGRHVDIINLYQYALSSGPDRAAVLHKRERVLHHLDKTLSPPYPLGTSCCWGVILTPWAHETLCPLAPARTLVPTLILTDICLLIWPTLIGSPRSIRGVVLARRPLLNMTKFAVKLTSSLREQHRLMVVPGRRARIPYFISCDGVEVPAITPFWSTFRRCITSPLPSSPRTLKPVPLGTSLISLLTRYRHSVPTWPTPSLTRLLPPTWIVPYSRRQPST